MVPVHPRGPGNWSSNSKNPPTASGLSGVRNRRCCCEPDAVPVHCCLDVAVVGDADGDLGSLVNVQGGPGTGGVEGKHLQASPVDAFTHRGDREVDEVTPSCNITDRVADAVLGAEVAVGKKSVAPSRFSCRCGGHVSSVVARPIRTLLHPCRGRAPTGGNDRAKTDALARVSI